MQIEQLIPGINLETSQVEFKGILEEGAKADGSRKERGWLKTLAAFANSEGGDLYVGIENKSHKVVALAHTDTDRMILMVHRLIKERIQPQIRYMVSTIAVPDTMPTRYVIQIHVERSKELPVTIHEGGLLGVYVRNYGMTETATPEQIRDMVLMSENVPYDQGYTDQIYRKEDYSTLYALAQERSISIQDKQLISIGFMSGTQMLSKGALLFRDQCTDSCTRISMSLWPDYDKGGDVVLANEVYTGNLLDGIKAATTFVRSHSANGYRKEADRRVRYIAYPERAVTEGVVNAVAHRNYYIQGAQIEINIFRDRLEISSPGSLLGVRRLQKEKDIAAIMPRRRNEVICDVLEMCRYMEEKGSGFDKIVADYSSAEESHRPYVTADGTSFTLTLPDLTWQGQTVATDGNVIPEIYALQVLHGKRDEAILAYCYPMPRTVADIAHYLQITPSTYFRKNTIGALVTEGLLRAIQDGRTIRYQSNREMVRLK